MPETYTVATDEDYVRNMFRSTLSKLGLEEHIHEHLDDLASQFGITRMGTETDEELRQRLIRYITDNPYRTFGGQI